MMDELIAHLSEVVVTDLPGEDAHVQMAPIQRPSPDEAKVWPDTKYAAVLILLYPYRERIYTSLMMRPDYNGVHSKQVSFPGGKVEKVDAGPRETALREANEELNIQSDQVEIIGEMSELYIPPSKSLVTPVLGYTKTKPDFIPDEKEVAAIIEADFMELLDDRNFTKTKVQGRNYILREVPAIIYNDVTIWGATAMMLNELKWLMRSFDSK